MSTLEAYVISLYGKWVPFADASKELGFDVCDAIAVTIKKSGAVSVVKDTKALVPRLKRKQYSYEVPVMNMTAVRSDSIRYIEFSHLLDLNMHLGC